MVSPTGWFIPLLKDYFVQGRFLAASDHRLQTITFNSYGVIR
jgi:hypothetical protein